MIKAGNKREVISKEDIILYCAWENAILPDYAKNYSMGTYVFCVDSSANPHMEIQPETLILGSNISSGVTVPSFGKKFAKLRQCEQFEV